MLRTCTMPLLDVFEIILDELTTGAICRLSGVNKYWNRLIKTDQNLAIHLHKRSEYALTEHQRSDATIDALIPRILRYRCHECGRKNALKLRNVHLLCGGQSYEVKTCRKCQRDPFGFRRLVSNKEIDAIFAEHLASGAFVSSRRKLARLVPIARVTRSRAHLYSCEAVCRVMKSGS